MPGYVRNRGKRSDGTTKWQARWRHPDDPAIRVEKVFRSKEVANRWLTQQESDAHNRMYRAAGDADRPFRELVEAWRETRLAHLSPRTVARYEQVLRTYLLPEWGDRKVTSLTREVTKRYFARLLRDGKSPGTVSKVQVVASSVFDEGRELWGLRDNPAARMKLPAAPPRDPLYLDPAQVRALADAINPHFRVLVYTAAYTGLRASELWALRPMDVDLARGVIHVRRALTSLDGADTPSEPTYGWPKNGKGRTVGLPAFLRPMLAEHLRTHPAPRDGLVFTTPQGAIIRQNLFLRRVFRPAVVGRPALPERRVRNGNGFRVVPARLAAEAALPPELHGLRFHDLRHTAASLFIATGGQPKQVMERMGHSDINTTYKRYGHLFDGHDAAMLDALDAAHREASNVIPLRPKANTA